MIQKLCVPASGRMVDVHRGDVGVPVAGEAYVKVEVGVVDALWPAAVDS